MRGEITRIYALYPSVCTKLWPCFNETAVKLWLIAKFAKSDQRSIVYCKKITHMFSHYQIDYLPSLLKFNQNIFSLATDSSSSDSDSNHGRYNFLGGGLNWPCWQDTMSNILMFWSSFNFTIRLLQLPNFCKQIKGLVIIQCNYWFPRFTFTVWQCY